MRPCLKKLLPSLVIFVVAFEVGLRVFERGLERR